MRIQPTIQDAGASTVGPRLSRDDLEGQNGIWRMHCDTAPFV